MRKFFLDEIRHNGPADSNSLDWLTVATGLKLPDPLRNIYLTSDGGYFKEYVLHNATEPWIAFSMHPNYISVSDIFSIEEIADRVTSIKDHCSDFDIDVRDDSFFLTTMLPFTTVDGFNPLCVACKGEETGRIYLVEWYFYHQNQSTLPFPKQLVANSIEELFSKMKISSTNDSYLKDLDNYHKSLKIS